MNLTQRLLTLSGIAVIAMAGIGAVAAILLGTSLWLGVPLDLDLPVPPQTLVIGGMFLAVPIAMAGYGMLWLAGWMRDHN